MKREHIRVTGDSSSESRLIEVIDTGVSLFRAGGLSAERAADEALRRHGFKSPEKGARNSIVLAIVRVSMRKPQ